MGFLHECSVWKIKLPQHNVNITKHGQWILNIICLIFLIIWYVWYVTEHGQFWPIRPKKNKLGPPKNSPPQTAFWSQPLLHQEFRFVPGPGSIEDLGWVKKIPRCRELLGAFFGWQIWHWMMDGFPAFSSSFFVASLRVAKNTHGRVQWLVTSDRTANQCY